MFLSYFSANERLEAKEVTDYGFLIHEFFSIHYNEDIHLRDIANYLHLAERQSERLIIDYTGHSFRDELVATRMNMAKILFSTTDMSLSEISQYVGYKSYNGFWKAAKKFNFFDSNR